MATVQILPFDEKLGFPQKQLVNINKRAYRLFYRWNHVGGFAVLRIRRLEDDKVVYEGKLTEKSAFEVYDPDTREVLFTCLTWAVNERKAEVWLFV